MTVLSRVVWGIGRLMWPAVTCCLIAATAYALEPRGPAGSPALAIVCAWYIGAAIAGGLVLGLLRPFTQSALGRTLAGFATALPVTAIILFANPFGRWPLDAVSVFVALGIAAVVGPLTAAYGFSQGRR